jgi:geranylgeranyl diphosphate synthase type II
MKRATLRGGKRLRPLLMLGVVDAFRGAFQDGLRAGAAIEMVHAASLIMDDLPCMDNATLRRGEKPLHCVVGERAAILAALALVNLAYEVLIALQSLPPEMIVKIQTDLARAIGRAGLVGGQWEDLRSSAKIADIEHVNYLKTGVLFEFACRCAGVLCKADAANLRRLSQFGRLFGIGYQMLDDICDLEATRLLPNDMHQQRRAAIVRIGQIFDEAQKTAEGMIWSRVAHAFIRPALAKLNH